MAGVFNLIARALGILGGLLGIVATSAIFVLPMYEGVSVTVNSTGERIEEHSSRTLLEMQSLQPVTIIFFGIILLLSLAAIFFSIRPNRARPRLNGIVILVLGVLLLFGSLISGFSVGGFYFPGALLVLLSGILNSIIRHPA